MSRVIVRSEDAPALVLRDGALYTTAEFQRTSEDTLYWDAEGDLFDLACVWVDEHTIDGSELFSIEVGPRHA